MRYREKYGMIKLIFLILSAMKARRDSFVDKDAFFLIEVIGVWMVS